LLNKGIDDRREVDIFQATARDLPHVIANRVVVDDHSQVFGPLGHRVVRNDLLGWQRNENRNTPLLLWILLNHQARNGGQRHLRRALQELRLANCLVGDRGDQLVFGGQRVDFAFGQFFAVDYHDHA